MECKKCGKTVTVSESEFCADCIAAEAEKRKREKSFFWEEVGKNQSAIEDFGYRVKTEIKKSENTVIYIATNDNNETVAIKKITVPFDGSASSSSDIHSELSEKVRCEMESLSQISKDSGNRFVITYYDYKLVYNNDNYKYDLYIKMDYLTSLGQLYADTEYKICDMLRMGIDVCDALEWCHKNGRAHNNLNLNNIFINNEGRYVLGDFAFSDNAKNEAEYCIAPELIYGKKPDASSDIYSLGMVMFTLLNGGLPPFAQTESDIALASKRLRNGEKPVLPVNINSRLRDAVHLAIDIKSKRYHSVEELKNVFEHLLNSMPSEWLNQNIKGISSMVQEMEESPAPKEPEPLPDKHSEENNRDKPMAPEDQELKKKNRKDLWIIGIVVAVLVAAIALGTAILSTAGNKKIYSLIESGSYAVAFKEISGLYDEGKNVDSLLSTYIEACCNDGEYKRVVQAAELFSPEVYKDVEYFRTILNEMLNSGKDKQAYALAEMLYEYEDMQGMLGELNLLV